MTTFTINEVLDLPSTNFSSVDDLLIALYRIKSQTIDIDFRPMQQHELTPEIIQSVHNSQGKALSSFSSISSL
jgi:hypothetical protein